MPIVDNAFADPRVAVLYDALDADRSDLDVYAGMVEEFETSAILDIGCGTGTLASRLAQGGKRVVGLDSSAAMIDVARAKPHAHQVRWLVGDAMSIPPMQVDLATMTGNVAQVFLTDDDWAATLQAVRAVLRPGGRLVFEARDPAKRAWRAWNREESLRRLDIADVGSVETWEDLIDVRYPLVTFRSTTRVESTGETIVALSTLRFRSRDELSASLLAAGFTVDEVRDAPDRPGLEFVFVARAARAAGPAG